MNNGINVNIKLPTLPYVIGYSLEKQGDIFLF